MSGCRAIELPAIATSSDGVPAASSELANGLVGDERGGSPLSGAAASPGCQIAMPVILTPPREAPA